ncbi:hypothetical protein ISN44_As10g011340 [Arabidopsis suecica]|uniref:Uncharacterized protein n=1 Tax=Arabidopsis suecica TaxID=45249 RepID=A0A8T1ZXQ4_ARASU|nr:hypothetical protein ISN44_As10g011340 [Arabidopsis suecica]
MAEGIRFTRARIGNFTQTMMGLHIISGLSLTMFAKLGVERVYLDCVDGLLVKFVVSTRLSNSYEDKRSHPQNCEDRGCLQISTKARQFVVMTNLVPYGFFGSRVVIDKCPDLQTLTSHLVASRPSQTVLIDVNPNTNWNYDMDCFQCKARKILKNQSRDVFLMELHSTTYYLLWKQPWGRQRILQHRHKEPLLHSSNILISMRRKDPESSPTTLSLNLLVNVMPRAFWSLSYKLLANIKCMKGGHNRLYLLACKTSERIARLYSTPSSKLFQFHVFAYNGCFGMFLLFVNSY